MDGHRTSQNKWVCEPKSQAGCRSISCITNCITKNLMNYTYIRLQHIFSVMMIATIGMFTIDNKGCSYLQKES